MSNLTLFSQKSLVFMDVDPHVNTHICPFLAFLSQIFKPCYAFLKVCFNKFDINVMQANQNLFIYCTILIGLCHGMPKKGALERFFQPKVFTTHNDLQWSNHCSQINTFVFDVTNQIFLNPNLLNKTCNFTTITWPLVLVASNSLIMMCLGYQFIDMKLTTSENMSWAPTNMCKDQKSPLPIITMPM